MGKPVAITPEAAVERELRRTVAREPANAEAALSLARLLARHGASDEAVARYEVVAALRPDRSEVLDELASACMRKQDLLAADFWLSRIAGPEGQDRLAELRRGMRKEARRLKAEAREHDAARRTDEAVAAYAQMAAHAPSLTTWRIEAVEFFLAVGRYEAAEAHLEDMEPDERIPPLLEAARALRRLHPRRRSPASLVRLYRSARSELKAGHAALAEPVFRELTLIDPHYPYPWVDLRAARLALGKTAAAVAVAGQWTAASPASAGVKALALARPVNARGLLFDLQDRFPVIPKEAALRRVGSAAELKTTADAYLVLDPGGRVEVDRPLLDLGKGVAHAVRIRRKPSFMMALDNAMVVGRGAVITQDGRLVSDQLLGRKAHKSHAVVHDGMAAFGPQLGREPLEAHYVDREALLCMGPTDLSFGDWLIHFPPRIMLAEAAGLDCSVLVNRDVPPKYLDMLEAAGVDRERLIFQKDLRAVVYRRLYVPGWPYGPLNRPIENWLSIYRRIARPPRSAGGRLIYLSRRHVANRPLVNEEEICGLFVRRGFEVVVPDGLSLEETVELFSSAACVAGPWGSSFENIVFSHTPPVAFALMPDYPRSYMQWVGAFMHAAGATFAYVRGEATGVRKPNTAPWRVSPDLVEQGLERVLGMIAERSPPPAPPAPELAAAGA